MVCCVCRSTGGGTGINGIVLPEKNVSTQSLQNNNLVLIIKNDENHDVIQHIRLSVNETSFPIQFNVTNIREITSNGSHLMTLLIFGYTHRLLWEGALFRQNLILNHVNSITFIVKDVSNLPVCLSQGYPCIETSDVADDFISMCCSNTRCQLSNTTQLTCGGLSPIIRNVTIIYVLPPGITPITGPLDQYSVAATEKLYQYISEPGTIVKIINATISIQSNQRNGIYNSIDSVKFILTFYVSIIISEQCQLCQVKTLRSIETKSIPFNIPRSDGSYIIVALNNASADVISTVQEQSTIAVKPTIATTELPLETSESPTTALTTETKECTWTPTTNMTYPRVFHTASVLLSGKVLMAGGAVISNNGSRNSLPAAELYDPPTGTWRLTGNMTYTRFSHTASVLSNGTVLVAGGIVLGSGNTSSTELYDPLAGTWRLTGNMVYPRCMHTSSVLLTGEVFVVGSWLLFGDSYSAELYNPSTGTWRRARNMVYPRALHTASVLLNGTVLVAGGAGDYSILSSVELYDPSTDSWSLIENMTYPRAGHTASILPNGTVLVIGGLCESGDLSSAELYDPSTGTWSLINNMTYPRAGHTASVLLNRTVLVVGAGEHSVYQSTAELYDLLTGTWSSAENTTYTKDHHTASVLMNGTVLVAGGEKNSTPLASAELFHLFKTNSCETRT